MNLSSNTMLSQICPNQPRSALSVYWTLQGREGNVLDGWLVRVADVFVVNVWLLRITGLCREASYVDTRMGSEKELGQQCWNIAGEEENGNSEKQKREMKKGCGNRLTNNYRASRLSPGSSCPQDVVLLQKDKGQEVTWLSRVQPGISRYVSEVY